jgi:putative peptidoglycan lipid II flippase
MSAVTPSLSAAWARRDITVFRHRMAFGLRGMLAIIIPSAVGMLILAHPLIDLVLLHGAESPAAADSTGSALAMFSLGLPGFCTFLYMVRVLQSMQDTRTAFGLYLVENAVNVVFGVLLVGPLGVRGLALSVSIAYSVAALLAMSVIRKRVGGLGGPELTTPVKRVVAASAVMAVVTVLALDASSAPSGFGLLGRVALAVVAGAVAYVATATILGARQAKRARAARSTAAEPTRPLERDGWDSPSPEPFRGRIDDRFVDPPGRHLRPVHHEPRDEEEDLHGPDPGDNR